jgi:hypothetical protein
VSDSACHEERLGRPYDPLARRRIRGILYREWLAHRDQILVFVTLWLVGLWILVAFQHPAFLLGFGLAYVVFVAPAFAGLDASEGSEEFSFSLPPTRGELYLTRFFLSGGLLAAMLVGGLVAIELGLPQRIWGLLVESGLTERRDVPIGETWTAVVLIGPLALFAMTFMSAAACTNRSAVGSAWLMGVLLTGILAGGSQIAEWFLFKTQKGWVAFPVLAISAGAAAILGFRVFTWKEGITRPADARRSGSAFAWVVGIFALIVLLGLLMALMFRPAPAPAP